MSYRDYRETQIENGKVFQDFVVDAAWSMLGLAIIPYSSRLYQMTVGESKTRCEIKFDMNYARTGNLYIETAEKAVPRDGPYAPSGIYRDDNTWLWVIGDYDRLFFIQKSLLRLMEKTGKYREVENRSETSLGFLVPDKALRHYSGVIIEPKCSLIIKQTAADLKTKTAELQRAAAELFAAATKNPQQMDLFQAGNNWLTYGND